MSKNDDRILELKKQIEAKKTELLNTKKKFTPETNCILELDGDGIKYNLNVLNTYQLTLLLIKLNAYQMSIKDLKISSPLFSGYTIDLWISDVKNKIEVLGLKQKEMELKSAESKLDKLLSDEKKTELELDEIAGLL